MLRSTLLEIHILWSLTRGWWLIWNLGLRWSDFYLLWQCWLVCNHCFVQTSRVQRGKGAWCVHDDLQVKSRSARWLGIFYHKHSHKTNKHTHDWKTHMRKQNNFEAGNGLFPISWMTWKSSFSFGPLTSEGYRWNSGDTRKNFKLLSSTFPKPWITWPTFSPSFIRDMSPDWTKKNLFGMVLGEKL